MIMVVIPTYNEADNLPALMSALFALPLQGLRVLVVDDNSPDGTGKLAEKLSTDYGGRIEVLHRAGKQGLGTAYLAGFRKAVADGADAIVQMDADFSHPIEKLVEMAEALKTWDVVIGSRYVKGGSLDERWSIWRKILSGWGNFYARTILRLPMRDVTGGFKMWRREVLADMPLDRIRSSGYGFQVEMNYVAYKLGYTFSEVPIYFADRRLGESKMSLNIQVEAAIRVWQMLWEYRNIRPTASRA
jgi:dolichol-phosphate mannosyltransferase